MRAPAAAALLCALALAGCASSRDAQVASLTASPDEEGCTFVARYSRADSRLRNREIDASIGPRNAGSPPVTPMPPLRSGQKIVRSELYDDVYACPKITIPDKRPD